MEWTRCALYSPSVMTLGRLDQMQNSFLLVPGSQRWWEVKTNIYASWVRLPGWNKVSNDTSSSPSCPWEQSSNSSSVGGSKRELNRVRLLPAITRMLNITKQMFSMQHTNYDTKNDKKQKEMLRNTIIDYTNSYILIRICSNWKSNTKYYSKSYKTANEMKTKFGSPILFRVISYHFN